MSSTAFLLSAALVPSAPLQVRWGTEDTALTQGQPFYSWLAYRNPGPATWTSPKDDSLHLYFVVKSQGREDTVGCAWYVLGPGTVIRPRNAIFDFKGFPPKHEFPLVTKATAAQLVLRATGNVTILDSTRAIKLLPPADPRFAAWFAKYDTLPWGRFHNLTDITPGTRKSMDSLQDGFCLDAEASRTRILSRAPTSEFFRIASLSRLSELCRQGKFNQDCIGIPNRNWPYLAEMSLCRENTCDDPHSNHCVKAYAIQDSFVGAKIGHRKEIATDEPWAHRLIGPQDTIYVPRLFYGKDRSTRYPRRINHCASRLRRLLASLRDRLLRSLFSARTN
jgi:hypothetical protein